MTYAKPFDEEEYEDIDRNDNYEESDKNNFLYDEYDYDNSDSEYEGDDD